jgi:hypothetical protein
MILYDYEWCCFYIGSSYNWPITFQNRKLLGYFTVTKTNYVEAFRTFTRANGDCIHGREHIYVKGSVLAIMALFTLTLRSIVSSITRRMSTHSVQTHWE